MNMPVYVDEPMERYCEFVDISVLGLRLDRELPCTPGVKVFFRLVIPSYGATPKPTEIELVAEVVRVEGGYTGLQFVALEQTRPARSASWCTVTSGGCCWPSARRRSIAARAGCSASAGPFRRSPGR